MYVQEAEFERDSRYITDRITADGRGDWPVEPGRYRLVVARACPWANRAIIVRRLLGLEPVLSMGVCGPVHDERSWTFDLDPGRRDPVLGYERLEEAYLARFPDYDRGITVPAMVDIASGQVVTNDFAQLTLDFSTEWRRYHRARRARPLPRGPARRDRRGGAAGLRRRQQRRLPLWVRRLAGVRTRRAYDTAVRPPRLAGRPPEPAALPGRRHDHRGRRAAVHHAGALRRRLPRPLQVQPAEAQRDAGAVGRTPATCSRPPASATPSTSTTSSATTTSSTGTSTRRASSRPVRRSAVG